MLYDAYGNPIRHDPRTPEQIEFDTKLKIQMRDNGGQYFPREFINRIKDGFVVRDAVRDFEKLKVDSSKTNSLDRVIDEYDDKGKFRSKKPHSA